MTMFLAIRLLDSFMALKNTYIYSLDSRESFDAFHL